MSVAASPAVPANAHAASCRERASSSVGMIGSFVAAAWTTMRTTPSNIRDRCSDCTESSPRSHERLVGDADDAAAEDEPGRVELVADQEDGGGDGEHDGHDIDDGGPAQFPGDGGH